MNNTILMWHEQRNSDVSIDVTINNIGVLPGYTPVLLFPQDKFFIGPLQGRVPFLFRSLRP